ncbi:hypothetical protein Bbelb_152690 [Branchiostoma belcheri]|nr:hypothetical protein Bbelb_152690 [Branchiostoma belcheri]
MPKNRFTHYAVARGRQPGIYTDWSQTKQQIDGFSSARYKGFHSEAEARAWMDEFHSNSPPQQNVVTVRGSGVIRATVIDNGAAQSAANQSVPRAGKGQSRDSTKRPPKNGTSDSDRSNGKHVMSKAKTGNADDLAEALSDLQLTRLLTFREALSTFRPGIYKGDDIKRLWSNLLQSWFEQRAQVYIISPWIDKKTMGYIKNRLMTGQSSIQALYIRDPCFTDTGGRETSLAEAMQGVFSASEADRIRCLRVGTDRETDGKAYFHCKFAAGRFENHVEILVTSANFNEHHFNPLQRDSVILLSENCRDFETRYLSTLDSVTREVSLATVLKS